MGKMYNLPIMTPAERSRFLRRRQQLIEQLHRLPNLMRGNVCVRQRRCGRSTCQCAMGGARHEGLQLTVTLEGRTVTRFVRQAELEEVTAMTENYRRLWAIVEELTKVNLEIMRGKQVGGRRRSR